MIKVSFGNKKLPTDTMIFNLPARVTCPGRTEFCDSKCYAIKAEKMYKAVLPARQGNFAEARREDFPYNMQLIIDKYVHKIKRVRVHESGDFFNQKYLDQWFFIAERFPALTFYAYTKSFHLDFIKKPSNFILIASFDQTSRPVNRLNYEAKRKYFANTFSIVDRHAQASCVQDCSICSACWTGRGKDITVNLH